MAPADPTATPAPLAADTPPPAARTNLIVAGAATTLVSYGLALGASFALSEDDLRGAKDLRVPIAGPWMELGKTGCPKNTPSSCTVQLVVGAILTIFDGVTQIGGLGMVGEGLFLNTSSAGPTPRKAGSSTLRRDATGPTVRAVPFNFEKGGFGLGVVGTF